MIGTGTVATIKTTWYIGAFTLFQFLGIPEMQMWILGTLMVIDFIAWVWKQYRLDPRNITSHWAWLWVMKKTATLMSILSVALIIKWLELDADNWIKWMLGILMMAEWYSIVQNIYTIRTGISLPEYDVVSILLKKLWEALRDAIDKSVTK